MVTKHVLAGKRIVVTRPLKQADTLRQRLIDAGAQVVLFPTIQLTAMPDTGLLDQAICGLTSYDWLVFTSANGVRFFWERLCVVGEGHVPETIKVAAIGPATAYILQTLGCEPTLVPDTNVAESLAAQMGDVTEQTILLPQAEAARPVLAESLTAQGGYVDAIATYQTVQANPEPKAWEALAQGVDVLTFTSSSTARNFAALLGMRATRLANTSVVACIGPITATTVQKLGWEAHVVALPYTTSGLVDALTHYFSTQS